MLQHALEAIREAERQATAILADAGRRAAELQEACSRDLKTMEERSAQETADRRKSLIADAEARGAADTQRIAAEAAMRSDELRAAAEARMEAAVAAVTKRLTDGGSAT
ncbi:hypothetical protein JXA88_14995 [Candidatus Fermentibacteria bacterium]|nr:hypothetical protein [Candidatus Fermentibacteria bacterium]